MADTRNALVGLAARAWNRVPGRQRSAPTVGREMPSVAPSFLRFAGCLAAPHLLTAAIPRKCSPWAVADRCQVQVGQDTFAVLIPLRDAQVGQHLSSGLGPGRRIAAVRSNPLVVFGSRCTNPNTVNLSTMRRDPEAQEPTLGGPVSTIRALKLTVLALIPALVRASLTDHLSEVFRSILAPDSELSEVGVDTGPRHQAQTGLHGRG